ncbi:Receptor-type tyrosine-protein phosphatase U [Takifugu flavidus]|uniref:protein-tyrosine-phosphatase n=1 Tax=Takifugu flavidus TaxID=433684 RepID=A0A5C6PKL0_9TELE|nr:Receptor-type tyrosine-protein phosphatase U [Takifugu flavidus]
MRALRGLAATDIQPRQLSLQWESLAFNLTRCHTYSVSLCYRYTTAGGGGGHNTTVRECLAVEHNASRFMLRDLPPYHSVHVRLSLANPEGKKEGREVTFQTDEDIPGGIAPESLTFTPLDDMIFLKWEEPVEPNGLITQYECSCVPCVPHVPAFPAFLRFLCSLRSLCSCVPCVPCIFKAYMISYQSIESSDPGINVPGPRRTVSKLRNETYHMFSNLHPGTTYLISVRARTAKGFGQTALTEITTNISAPTFDYGDMPSPLSETDSTITVLLRPAQGRGAPVSTYQVVVEEEMGKKVKRELGLQECFPLPMSHGEAQARGTPHYYTAELPPSSLPEASPFTVGDNHTYNGYWNSPLDPRKSYLVYFQAMSNFRGVSDGESSSGGSAAAGMAALHQPYVDISIQDNSKPAWSGVNERLRSLMLRLMPRDTQVCHLLAGTISSSSFTEESRINCIRIARKAACKDQRKALEVSQHSEEMGLILGVCAGGLVVLILLLGAVIIIIKKGKPVNMNKTPITYRQEKSHLGSMERSFTDQSTLQEDERMALSFMDAHTCGTRGDGRSLVNEASSLLGGSPRHQCGRKGSPYHTGQLHPAVRVADLLQHINQMKTAEGYGFKQEYEVKGRFNTPPPCPEQTATITHSDSARLLRSPSSIQSFDVVEARSVLPQGKLCTTVKSLFWFMLFHISSFFDGWDCTKKKDKTKGRHDTLLGYDRHRVKLHPLLGDPNSDYINANYIDGYHRSNHFIATQGPMEETLYDFWRMVWQENCFSIVMITKLVEVGRVKCCKYWPDDSEMYGDIKITLLKTETLAEYTVRTFALERRGYSTKHEVRQFHFTSWPDHGVPYHATGLLAFIRRVKASTPPDAGPVVVHCSVGAGRTGCYIVLDVMLDMAECEGVVDIYNCVKTLCSRRINMIQTEEQYVFIHDAILEACLCGETAIPMSEFAVAYKELLRVDSQSNSSPLREEFQVRSLLDAVIVAVNLAGQLHNWFRTLTCAACSAQQSAEEPIPTDKRMSVFHVSSLHPSVPALPGLFDSTCTSPASGKALLDGDEERGEPAVLPYALLLLTLNSVTPHLDVEECSIALLPRNREKNRSMDVLPPDRALAFLVTTEGESNNYINAALADSFHRQAAFIVTPHPLPGTTADFWRLVFDYGCTAVVMLNQLNQSNSAWPCVQYWPEPGLQQYGPMEVEFLSMSADEDVITRLFRVKNVTRLQEGQLVVCQFQFLRWSAYRDVPDSKKAFLNLLAQVHKWQRECGEGRTVVHCLTHPPARGHPSRSLPTRHTYILAVPIQECIIQRCHTALPTTTRKEIMEMNNGGGRSGSFCACNILLEMIQYQNMVDIFYAVKTLRNCKPNMVESLDQYRFCYDLVLEYLDCFDGR